LTPDARSTNRTGTSIFFNCFRVQAQEIHAAAALRLPGELYLHHGPVMRASDVWEINDLYFPLNKPIRGKQNSGQGYLPGATYNTRRHLRFGPVIFSIFLPDLPLNPINSIVFISQLNCFYLVFSRQSCIGLTFICIQY